MIMKCSLCIFAVAVLLGPIRGDLSEMDCVSHQFFEVTPERFIGKPASLCLDVEMKFDRVNEELKNCTSLQIDTNLLKSLYSEFCTDNSDFRQKFLRQELCLHENMPKAAGCEEEMRDEQTHAKHEGKRIQEACHSATAVLSKCKTEKSGRPCGDEGVEVYNRMVKASEPFIEAICLKLLKEALPEGTSVQTANSPFLWYILLGLLFAVKW